MYKAATIMVWFPVTSAILLLPVSVSRLLELSNVPVPFGFTVFVTTLYNLGGLINAIQLWRIQKHFPDLSTLPRFNTARKQFRISAIIASRDKAGSPIITPTPYLLGRSDTAEKYQRQKELIHQVTQINRMSYDSTDSGAPLIPPEAHTYTARRSQGPAGHSYSSSVSSDSVSMYSSSTAPTLPEIDRRPAAAQGQWSSDVDFELMGAAEGTAARQSRTQPVVYGGPRRWI